MYMYTLWIHSGTTVNTQQHCMLKLWLWRMRRNWPTPSISPYWICLAGLDSQNLFLVDVSFYTNLQCNLQFAICSSFGWQRQGLFACVILQISSGPSRGFYNWCLKITTRCLLHPPPRSLVHAARWIWQWWSIEGRSGWTPAYPTHQYS